MEILWEFRYAFAQRQTAHISHKHKMRYMYICIRDSNRVDAVAVMP